jgi:hypothetical protein
LGTIKPDSDDFASETGKKRTGLLSEFLYFLAHNKKWWLLPIIIILFLLALLVVLGGSPLAPLMYTVF